MGNYLLYIHSSADSTSCTQVTSTGSSNLTRMTNSDAKCEQDKPITGRESSSSKVVQFDLNPNSDRGGQSRMDATESNRGPEDESHQLAKSQSAHKKDEGKKNIARRLSFKSSDGAGPSHRRSDDDDNDTWQSSTKFGVKMDHDQFKTLLRPASRYVIQ